MARGSTKLGEARLSGNVVVGELIRNMEQGRFEMSYTVLMPCVFTVYLNPDDFAILKGVSDHIVEDARRALRARMTDLNSGSSIFGSKRKGKEPKEHKIACRDWTIELLPHAEVPAGDVEIHSELNENAEAAYRGTKTTLIDREPSVPDDLPLSPMRNATRATPESVFAEIRYEDDSGAQVFLVTQNEVRVGRGGDQASVELALFTTDEVSREHLVIRRNPATGRFTITDLSTNGTSLGGKRLRKGSEEPLPTKAEINVGDVLTLTFEVVLRTI